MNSITEIKDCMIVKEIERIKNLSNEQLIRELIEVKTMKIEEMTDVEIFKILQKNGNRN